MLTFSTRLGLGIIGFSMSSKLRRLSTLNMSRCGTCGGIVSRVSMIRLPPKKGNIGPSPCRVQNPLLEYHLFFQTWDFVNKKQIGRKLSSNADDPDYFREFWIKL